jgi:hypothetical protein
MGDGAFFNIDGKKQDSRGLFQVSLAAASRLEDYTENAVCHSEPFPGTGMNRHS